MTASPPQGSPPPIEFGGSTPILRVADVARSLAFYTGQLGFTLDFRQGGFAGISRGRAHLMLSQGEQGHAGAWVYVGVSDCDALHAELLRTGVAVRVPPGNYPWGAREMQVSDPDGHVLRFGSDAVPGASPGEWIDDSGTRWQVRPDGTWNRVG